MKKYLGLIVLVALGCTSLLAVKAAPNEKQKAGSPGTLNEAQLSQLDKRLADRIAEQQELLAMVERLLNMNFQGKAAERAKANNVLSGGARPPAPMKVSTGPKAAPPPWWTAYKPQMTYLSGSDRYAVINAKMVGAGQALGDDVVVESIDDATVVLRRKKELHTYQMKK